MPENNINQSNRISFKAIITGMLIMFIIVHIGFHATYIKHFPEFPKFTWIHHVHGALMGSWVLLLVVQPILIYKKRFNTHRFLGRITYVIAPLIIISMILVAKQGYQIAILKKASADIMAVQSITWLQLFLFAFFYALAIYYRKLTYYHMRFMIGTAILMIGPPLNRILFVYFPEIGIEKILPFVLYTKSTLVAALLIKDLVKKKNWVPYFIVLIAFLFADIVYHSRYSDAWQSVGNFVVNNLYK